MVLVKNCVSNYRPVLQPNIYSKIKIVFQVIPNGVLFYSKLK